MTSVQSLMVKALYIELFVISFLQASHDPRVHAEISAITGHIKKATLRLVLIPRSGRIHSEAVLQADAAQGFQALPWELRFR